MAYGDGERHSDGATANAPPARPRFTVLEALNTLRIEIEQPLTPFQCKAVFLLAERHTLTIYDAAYLEVAQRLRLPLATLDKALIRAAQADGTPLVP